MLKFSPKMKNIFYEKCDLRIKKLLEKFCTNSKFLRNFIALGTYQFLGNFIALIIL